MAVCIEKKLTLSGKVFFFECELVCLKKEFGLLKYVIDRDYHVGPVSLHPGDVTYALYWTDRQYTLYVWHLQESRINYYFNIADSVSLNPEEFVWRDLSVDILIDADRKVHVLDEEELPENISSGTSSFILNAKNMILRNYPQIIQEARQILEPIIAKNR